MCAIQMPDGKFRTMLLETVRPGFMFDGYSFKIAQTTIAGTRTPNLQAQRTATINSKQLTDHVLSSIIRGRDVCRLLLLAGVALKDDEMITEFLARCSSSPTAEHELRHMSGCWTKQLSSWCAKSWDIISHCELPRGLPSSMLHIWTCQSHPRTTQSHNCQR